ARIARDRPDILEQMKAGEFTSVREAARAAGLVKQTSLVQQVLHLWQKATPEERQMIRQRLGVGQHDERRPRDDNARFVVCAVPRHLAYAQWVYGRSRSLWSPIP